MRKIIFGWTAVLGLVSGGAAQATILTFEDVRATQDIQTLVSSQGFNFTSTHIHTYGCGHAGYEDLAFNGTTKIGYEGERGGPITMTRQGGGTFTLASLDVGEFFHNGPGGAGTSLYPDKPNAEWLRITGWLLDGSSVMYQLAIDGIADGIDGVADFQHFVLPSLFVNVTSLLFEGVRLDGQVAGLQLDNLEIVDDNTVSVPEPASLGLMGLSLLGMAYARRRRELRK